MGLIRKCEICGMPIGQQPSIEKDVVRAGIITHVYRHRHCDELFQHRVKVFKGEEVEQPRDSQGRIVSDKPNW